MMNAQNVNEISKLSVVLSTLEEAVFFSKLCEFIKIHSGEHKVQIYKSFEDGASQLVSEDGKAVSGEILLKGAGLSGYVIRTKRAYYSNNVKRDPLLSTQKYSDGINAELCVPMICEGGVVGTIHIQSLSENKNYNESHVAEILTILKQVEQPIKNMKMFLAAKHLSQELMRKIQDSQDSGVKVQASIQPVQDMSKPVELIGISKSFKDIVDFVTKVAKSSAHLLVEGEGGTGKEALARKIHQLSSRSKQSFLIADCVCRNEAQLDEEIFGSESKQGLIEKAQGGTLFIEEVAALSISLQAKLFHFLMRGEVIKSNASVVSSDTRIVVASKKDLKKEVNEAKFREDLYFRLVNMSIKIPALRERKDDIRILAEHFMNLGKAKDECKVLTASALETLVNYAFPGNVRELKSMMERLFIMADSRIVDETLLPESIKEAPAVAKSAPVQFLEMSLEELEKSHICKTLDHLKGNKTKAAKSLGITVKTLYNKLHAYGMVNKDELSLQ